MMNGHCNVNLKRTHMNITWQAEDYRRHFSYVSTYGSALLDLIDLGKTKTVLDLGCGTGELTYALSKLALNVTGLDSSEEQLKLARTRYPQLSFILGQALDLPFKHQFDLVLSNAVLHWIDKQDHPQLLRSIRRALTPHGGFIFECGGRGNNAKIHAALAKSFAEFGYRYDMPFYFPSQAEYCALLEQEGFCIDSAICFERPTKLAAESSIQGFIRMFMQKPLQTLQPQHVSGILERTEQLLMPSLYHHQEWIADYVRLRIKAHLS